jgi:hypothetical protein
VTRKSPRYRGLINFTTTPSAEGDTPPKQGGEFSEMKKPASNRGLFLIVLSEYAVGHMKAQRSAILLSGLLVLMFFMGWAQTSDTARPTCPPVSDSTLQTMLQPTAWVLADWNAKTSRWDIDCTQIDAIANMQSSIPFNGAANWTNAANVRPAKKTTPKRRPSEE